MLIYLQEKYLSPVLIDRRLPGLAAKRDHIPSHSHFTLRDPSQAPGAIPAVTQKAVPSKSIAAAATTSAAEVTSTSAGAGGGISRPSSSSRPSSAEGFGTAGLRPSSGLIGRPPMRPPRPGSSGIKLEEGNIFMSGKRPMSGPGSGGVGGLAARPGVVGSSGRGGGSRFAPKQKKKTALLDISAVAQLNQAAMAEKQQQLKEQEAAKEAAAQARAEARKAEKEAKEEKKKREAARIAAQAAAAKEALKAEKEAERERKEKEAIAAKEAREAAKEAKEAERLRKEADYRASREEAARKKTEELAEKEAQRAKREAERQEKEAAKAARVELKRAAMALDAEKSDSRPAKVARTSVHATPSALAQVQSLMESNVLERGAPGEAPLVQLIDPQVALAALREAQSLEEGEYYGQDQGQYDPDVLRYIQMGQAAGGGGGGEEESGNDGGND